jgi:hypothetical protein
MAVSTNRDIYLSSLITLYMAVSTNRDIDLSSLITLYMAVSTNRDISLSSLITLYMAVSINRGFSVLIFVKPPISCLLFFPQSQTAREHIHNIMH